MLSPLVLQESKCQCLVTGFFICLLRFFFLFFWLISSGYNSRALSGLYIVLRLWSISAFEEEEKLAYSKDAEEVLSAEEDVQSTEYDYMASIYEIWVKINSFNSFSFDLNVFSHHVCFIGLNWLDVVYSKSSAAFSSSSNPLCLC